MRRKPGLSGEEQARLEEAEEEQRHLGRLAVGDRGGVESDHGHRIGAKGDQGGGDRQT